MTKEEMEKEAKKWFEKSCGGTDPSERIKLRLWVIWAWVASRQKGEEEINRLNRYEIKWRKLKDQLRRDREQGHIQKTARAWLLMQELEKEVNHENNDTGRI